MKYPATSVCDDADDSFPLVGVRLNSYHDGSLFGATVSFGTRSCTVNSLDGINVPGKTLQGATYEVANGEKQSMSMEA